MIHRVLKNLAVREGPAPPASVQLEADGWARLPAVLDAGEVAALAGEIDEVFATSEPERTRSDRAEFRYEMLNRSAACQAVVGHPRILEVVEPLLGEDCHVIANTAWRNPPEFHGWTVALRRRAARSPARGRPVGRPDPVSRVRGRRTFSCATAPRPTGRPRSFPAATAPVDSHHLTSFGTSQ